MESKSDKIHKIGGNKFEKHENGCAPYKRIFPDGEIVEYEEFLHNFDQKFKDFLEYKQLDKFVQLYPTTDHIVKNMEHYKLEKSGDEDFEKIYATYLENKKLFEQVLQIAKEIEENVSMCTDDTGFVIGKEHNGVITSYKAEKDKPTVLLKMEGMIDAPLFNVLAVINECDLWSKSFPRLSNSEIKKQVSRFGKIVYLRTVLPAISARESYLFGQGVDLLEHNDCVIILSRDCTDEEYGGPVPPPNGHDVRMPIHHGAFLLTPIDENKTKVVWMTNPDPKLNVVPYWLINWAVKKVSPHFFQMIKDLAMNLPEEFKARIKQNGEVYDEIKRRSSDYFERKRKETQNL